MLSYNSKVMLLLEFILTKTSTLYTTCRDYNTNANKLTLGFIGPKGGEICFILLGYFDFDRLLDRLNIVQKTVSNH